MTRANSESWVAPGTRAFDVLALGEPLIEFNQVQTEPPMYLQGFGGDTLNAMIAAARAGAKTAGPTLCNACLSLKGWTRVGCAG